MENTVCPYCDHPQTEHIGKTTGNARNKIEIFRCFGCGENHLAIHGVFTIPAAGVWA